MNRILGLLTLGALIEVGVIATALRIQRARLELGDAYADFMLIVLIAVGLALVGVLAASLFSVTIRHRRIRGSSDERLVFETDRTPALQSVVKDGSPFPASALPRRLSVSIDQNEITLWSGLFTSRRLASVPWTSVVDAVAVGDAALEIRVTEGANLQLSVVAPILPSRSGSPSFVARLVAAVNRHAAAESTGG
jgi:hypothetical protein